MKYTEGSVGRIFIIRFHDGDRLPDDIVSFAEEKKISNALCLFFGGIQGGGKIIAGPSNSEKLPPDPIITILRGVHEACGLGTIVKNEKGIPTLHMHTSFGRAEKVTTGCIRLGIDVWQIAEAVILEIKDSVAYRKKDPKTGFELLEIE